MITFFRNFQKNWAQLLQFSTILISFLGTFILLPPRIFNDLSLSWTKFGDFFVIALVGLCFLPLRLKSSKNHAKGWWLISICFFFLSTFSYFFYQINVNDKTTYYPENSHERFVIGEHYLTDTQVLIKKIEIEEGRKLSKQEVIFYKAGMFNEVWPEIEIRNNYFVLYGIYLLNLVCAIFFILSLIQSIYCQSRRT